MVVFYYMLEYKPGKGNVVVESLSRKFERVSITMTNYDIRVAIKNGM